MMAGYPQFCMYLVPGCDLNFVSMHDTCLRRIGTSGTDIYWEGSKSVSCWYGPMTIHPASQLTSVVPLDVVICASGARGPEWAGG